MNKIKKLDCISADALKVFEKYKTSGKNKIKINIGQIWLLLFYVFPVSSDIMKLVILKWMMFFFVRVKLEDKENKTDQYRSGNEVLISELNSVDCPVKYMKYFNVCNIVAPGREFLFKPMYRYGKTSGLIKSDRRLSYTRARECVVNRLRELCLQIVKLRYIR